MDARELSNLRLSARTLAEWRTPASAPSYEGVFGDLLSVHPFARELGIDAASRVLSFDRDGTILWYLSETLSLESPDLGGDEDLQWAVANHCIHALFGFARIGKTDIEVWPQGPLTSQVADEIDVTLEKGLCSFLEFREASEYLNIDLQCSRSTAALVSIAAPLGQGTSLAMIMQLKADYTRRRYVQKVSSVIRKIIRAMKATQTMGVGAAVVGAVLSISVASEVSYVLVSISIMSVLLSGLSKVLGDRLKDDTTNATSLIVAVIRQLTGVSDAAFPRLVGLPASKKEALGRGLICALGRICGDRNQAMVSLFREGSDDMWRRAAFLGTTSVKASIVSEILPLIRSSELSFGMRNELLKWLFSVAIEG